MIKMETRLDQALDELTVLRTPRGAEYGFVFVSTFLFFKKKEFTHIDKQKKKKKLGQKKLKKQKLCWMKLKSIWKAFKFLN